MQRKQDKYLVKFGDKKLRKDYYKILSVISVIFTLLSIEPVKKCVEKYIIADNDDAWRGLLICYIFSLILAYIILWIYANKKEKIKLNINGNILEIRQGDIFDEPNDVWKVINVNEFFDTELGGKESLVSSELVQGKYLKKYYSAGVTELDARINEELSCIQGKRKVTRKCGKNIRYPLGTLFCDVKDDRRYLLTAFSKMDDANRAYLSMKDYVNFLMNFWEEIDKVYDGHSVTVSLFGTGILRMDSPDITEQNLLELIIWSFRNSHIKLAYGAKVTILLYGKVVEKINLFDLSCLQGE